MELAFWFRSCSSCFTCFEITIQVSCKKLSRQWIWPPFFLIILQYSWYKFRNFVKSFTFLPYKPLWSILTVGKPFQTCWADHLMKELTHLHVFFYSAFLTMFGEKLHTMFLSLIVLIWHIILKTAKNIRSWLYNHIRLLFFKARKL